ncbi:hypothetical protein [Arsukibacterium sp.]|uniref:hypothetical protein n=1 Tax=Arsukibacterium sp. TaxID=1977258 RepID=UPI001BD47849|nr:hypothetical protein [Arsukibacterium sp.]
MANLNYSILVLPPAEPRHQHRCCAATEQLGLTLNYASPEQQQGKALSTLSDVYALGLILQLVGNSANSDLCWIIQRALRARAAKGISLLRRSAMI